MSKLGKVEAHTRGAAKGLLWKVRSRAGLDRRNMGDRLKRSKGGAKLLLTSRVQLRCLPQDAELQIGCDA